MNFSYDYFRQSADYVRELLPQTPDLAIILGTALGPFAEQLGHPTVIDYSDIPNFLRSTAPSHAGKLIYGTLGDKKILCMSGRFHSYEGYDMEQLTVPIRLFSLLGIKRVILTNAAGAVNESYRPGDIMVIRDHIKFTGFSPLRGKNLEEFGPRFFDVSEAYTPSLRRLALSCAEGCDLTVHEGVYFFMSGPQFETPAEIRAIRILGGDAVGMSTVTEVLTAAHCSMEVLALSVMTNMAAGILGRPLTGAEVDETAKTISERFSRYVTSIISAM